MCIVQPKDKCHENTETSNVFVCLWLKPSAEKDIEFNILKMQNRTGGDEFVGDYFQWWINLHLVLW